MIDAVGRVVLGVPRPWTKTPFPTVCFDVRSVIGDVKLGRMRYNYAKDYEEAENYVRMTFVPDNKMLIHPSSSSEPGKTMQLLEDILVLGILAGSLDTLSTFGVSGLVPYNVIRDYGSQTNQEINEASLRILQRYGFRQDSRKDKKHVYIFNPNYVKQLETYKDRRENEMRGELCTEATRILQKI